MVRIPDVAFVSWDRLPGGKRPNGPIPHLVPDLVVEMLSKSNTKREMDRKLREYFEAGVAIGAVGQSQEPDGRGNTPL